MLEVRQTIFRQAQPHNTHAHSHGRETLRVRGLRTAIQHLRQHERPPAQTFQDQVRILHI
jgi:hypothetical protein